MGRIRRAKATASPQHMDERWAVSYLDMMTVLFLTFVVLFSMSSIDAAKYEELKNALATGFGQDQTDLDDTVAALPVQAPDSEGATTGSAQTAPEKLEAIEAGVRANLDALGRADEVEFDRTDSRLVIRVLSGETLFTPDDATLSASAVKLLRGITPVILAEEGRVSVEGHADYRQPRNYETNWELSADRAVQVVRHMVERQGMPPGSVSATGYGDARPIGGKRDMLDRNRRVDIVVVTEDDPGATKRPATTAETRGAAGTSG